MKPDIARLLGSAVTESSEGAIPWMKLYGCGKRLGGPAKKYAPRPYGSSVLRALTYLNPPPNLKACGPVVNENVSLASQVSSGSAPNPNAPIKPPSVEYPARETYTPALRSCRTS